MLKLPQTFFLPLRFCCIIFLQYLIIRQTLAFGSLEFFLCQDCGCLKCPLTSWVKCDFHKHLPTCKATRWCFSPLMAFVHFSTYHLSWQLVIALQKITLTAVVKSSHFALRKQKKGKVNLCLFYSGKNPWKAVVGVSLGDVCMVQHKGIWP